MPEASRPWGLGCCSLALAGFGHLIEGYVRLLEFKQAEELSALLAQAEFGDYNQNTAQYSYSDLCGEEPDTATINRYNMLNAVQQRLQADLLKSKISSLLWSITAWSGTGSVTQMHRGWPSAWGQKGSPSIATQSGKSVYLTVTKDTNDSVVLLFKLISNRAASGLYRAITETHAFYRCDTVTNAVMMQYSRDFKGHLASLFLNEHINVGKKYVFDIRRTSKEVYDHARRALYNAGIVDLVSRTQSGERSSPSHSPSRDSQQDMGLDCSSCQQSRALQERLRKLKEALLCMLCCEEEIDAAFCPCGHMVCCQNCANQLQLCPVCRSEVEHVQHVYLPTCTSLLSLTLNDNHQHRSSVPTPIHRDTDSPHSCSTTEYEHKLYHA
ncbi:hypothetical protein GOODEAATRI_016995 [Goodea atripinnis]|uniref:RING-type domain-containing protein n=1 Tax=Goodea atripinnis TaxID=208336 RepID=A0ABV0N230_9TELE